MERSTVLFPGEPGIGKSTALTNEVHAATPERVLHFDVREFASDTLS